MESSFQIRDLAVIARHTQGCHFPTGEANRERGNYKLMSNQERQAMCLRLGSCIMNLMDIACSEHLTQTSLHVNAQEVITRLSTNEFFFYTKEPLNLNEFEKLQEILIEKAEGMPAGIHLILGSFAINIQGKGLINVTPFIVCGKSCEALYIVKNYPNPIDVSYQNSNGRTIPLLGINSIDSSDLPLLSIQNKTYTLDFYNVVPCLTPLGKPFKTVIDICLDHNQGIGIENITNLLLQDASILQQPVSHIVISNSTRLQECNSIGPALHNDPHEGKIRVADIESIIELPFSFGTVKVDICKYRPIECEILQTSLVNRQQKIEFRLNKAYSEAQVNSFKNQIATLDKFKLSLNDLHMETFILEVKERFCEECVTPILLLRGVSKQLQEYQLIGNLLNLLKKYQQFIDISFISLLEKIENIRLNTAIRNRNLPEFTRNHQYLLDILINSMNLEMIENYFFEKLNELCVLCLDINKCKTREYANTEYIYFTKHLTIRAKLEQLRDLENTIEAYEQNRPEIEIIQEKIKKYREGESFFYIDMQSDVLFIERVLQNMSIKDCCNFHDVSRSISIVFQRLDIDMNLKKLENQDECKVMDANEMDDYNSTSKSRSIR